MPAAGGLAYGRAWAGLGRLRRVEGNAIRIASHRIASHASEGQTAGWVHAPVFPTGSTHERGEEEDGKKGVRDQVPGAVCVCRVVRTRKGARERAGTGGNDPKL